MRQSLCGRRPSGTLIGVMVAGTAVGTVVARRMGYGIGGVTVVRCRQDHLFTTVWIPGVSVKAVRLGWWRFQRCPVGKHWTVISPVRARDLSEEDLREAHAHPDIPVP